MAPTPTQWNDALEKRFLLEVITLANGANMATFDVIAKKWGGSHTKGSLNAKFKRLKDLYAKENQGEEGASDSGVGGEEVAKKSPGKRKAKENGGEAAKKSKVAHEDGVNLEGVDENGI